MLGSIFNGIFFSLGISQLAESSVFASIYGSSFLPLITSKVRTDAASLIHTWNDSTDFYDF